MDSLFSEPARERLISKSKLLHDTLISSQEFDPSLYSLTLSPDLLTRQLPASTDQYALSISSAYLNIDARDTITQVEVSDKKKDQDEEV